MSCLFLKRSLAVFVLCAALVSGCSGERPGSSGRVELGGNWTVDDARRFDDFALYAPGRSFEEHPLTAVLRRFDSSSAALPVRPNFVSFIYGSCDTGPTGCLPPLDVQVWAACERNPGVYPPSLDREGALTIRGVPGFFYEGGRRLELSTGASTVVIFAQTRAVALRAADALEGVNNGTKAGDELPPPSYARQHGGVIEVLPCPYDGPPGEVARALRKSLAAAAGTGHQKEPRSVECSESRAPKAEVALDHFYDCTIAWADRTTVGWCILARGEQLLLGTFKNHCRAAAAAAWPGPVSLLTTGATGPIDERTARWAVYADVTCREWRTRQAEAMANLDQEMLHRDFSYIWSVMRPYEAGLLEDLLRIPEPPRQVQQVLRMYRARLNFIDRGLETYRKGKERRGVELFDRATRRDAVLSRRFSRVGASACVTP